MNRAAPEPDRLDAELVARAQRGSPMAFGELVARYQDRLFNTCYRLCHNEADALDLTQTAFLKALEALPKFQRRANFYTWLFRIAVNLVSSHLRTKGRRHEQPLDAADDGDGRHPDPPDTRATDPSEPAEAGELEDRVARALERLDAEFRVPVVLKDIEDMDYAQIADVLDIPVGTVKSRIHRGRLQLRELLAPERQNLAPS